MAEKIPKNIGDAGGPILGGIHRAIKGMAKRPTDAAGTRVEAAGKRFQGRMAHRASQAENPVARIALANLGGQFFPTRRASVARSQRGLEQNAADNEQSIAVLRSRYERAGSVAAGKAQWVESTRNGGRDAEQAIILLLGSDSWKELQDLLIQGGRNQGKRVTEIAEWQHALSDPYNPKSGDLWKLVGGRRPDLTPDVQQGAEQALSTAYGQQLTYGSIPGNMRHLLDQLSYLSLTEAVNKRVGVSNLAGLHESFFTEIGRMADPTLSTDLIGKLRVIKAIPFTGPQALGHFSDAGPKQAAIDAALASIGESYATI